MFISNNYNGLFLVNKLPSANHKNIITKKVIKGWLLLMAKSLPLGKATKPKSKCT